MREKIALWFFVLCAFGSLYAKEPTVYFTGETDLAKKCIEYIQRESTSIRIASHRLSNVQVIMALLQAHKRGVFVEVVVDAETVTKHSRLQLLAAEGVAVSIWKAGNKKKDHMHHSFCVFGKELTWVGSYSFSLQKKFSHKENAVVLEDETMAQSFLKEFDAVKMSCPLSFSEYLRDL
ncbi:MAG: phospholipase D-like domain-containing protein [Chlamydiota bacterium]